MQGNGEAASRTEEHRGWNHQTTSPIAMVERTNLLLPADRATACCTVTKAQQARQVCLGARPNPKQARHSSPAQGKQPCCWRTTHTAG
jgi:hypothetical protein